MRRLLGHLFILVLLLGTSLVASPARANDAEDAMHFQADELIIQYHKLKDAKEFDENGKQIESEDAFLDKVAKRYHIQKKHLKNRKLRRKLRRRRFKSKLALIPIDAGLSKRELKNLVRRMTKDHMLGANYEVDAVYPNYIAEITGTNDPLNEKQWSHSFVKPESLWKVTKGAGVVVAVIDTGVDINHQDLKDNIWVNPKEIAGNGKDDDGNGFIDDIHGWDFIDKGGVNCAFNEDCSKEDNKPEDKNGHGTHVAGLIAAKQNNGIGISGMAPEAKIMALKAAYSTGGSAFLKTSDIIEAVTYAVDNRADVINMSFAGPELHVLDDVMRLAESLGIVAVAAAGNASTSRATYPAALPSVLSVGAIASDGNKAHFSNYGDWVDIVAPGSWILSTVPNHGYDYKSGTSMAAPLVSGVAALIKAKKKLTDISATDVKSKIIAAGVDTNFRRFKGLTETIDGLNAQIGFSVEVDNVVLPAQMSVGTEAVARAEASDLSSPVINYEWYSNLDGYLGDSHTVDLSDLSVGSHSISVRAQNSRGSWSETVYKVINVVDEARVITPNTVASDVKFKIKKRKKRLLARVAKRSRREVVAYKWDSSKDGTISNSKSLSLNGLSSGYHRISLSVQDADGNWSEPIDRLVRI